MMHANDINKLEKHKWFDGVLSKGLSFTQITIFGKSSWLGKKHEVTSPYVGQRGNLDLYSQKFVFNACFVQEITSSMVLRKLITHLQRSFPLLQMGTNTKNQALHYTEIERHWDTQP